MPPLTGQRMADLLQPYIDTAELTPEILANLSQYAELVLRWNAHTNLTAVRDPEELVQRQIGESLFAARFMPSAGTLLDFGSGAGFPGVPLQLLRPGLKVTLAESQGKKASFLREAVRTLSLKCEVWAKRVERLPVDRQFDVVIMRAVDETAAMMPVASSRVGIEGSLVRYVASGTDPELPGWIVRSATKVPRSDGRLVSLHRI